MKVLGISCYYHDAAACVLDDGVIVAAAQEERFTRKKHDDAFPHNAIRYCLAEVGETGGTIDVVAFYDKPILKFHRILETYFGVAPRGLKQFVRAVPLWLREKMWIESDIRKELVRCGVQPPEKILFTEHHESHAASAFYPSPFEEAVILTVDGVGEWSTASLAVGEGADLKLIEEINFPHSLGLLYSAFTYFVGFRVNSGEYKLMGLAPYGKPVYRDLILDKMLDLREDGSFRLNMDYFGYLDDLVMTTSRFDDLLGGPPRQPEAAITHREMDIAKSIQEVTEEIVLRMARYARKSTGKRYLCMAGGVALNCVANGRILQEGIFDDIWIQPAAGDAGGALGAACSVWHNVLGKERTPLRGKDRMSGSYLGPRFSDQQVKEFLDARDAIYTELSEEEWAATLAEFIDEGKVVGLLQGRMEFGPRALGNRSIVGDPRSPKMQSIMNQKIKFRESFRPFAPSCLEERVGDYFDLDRPSPYMLLVAPVREDLCHPAECNERDLPISEWVNMPRSTLPAITHVDYSARVQSVSPDTNPAFHALIKAFEQRTGCAAVINTSFNVRGEPIVCTPEDAYNCFLRTKMDVLALGRILLKKEDQPVNEQTPDFGAQLILD